MKIVNDSDVDVVKNSVVDFNPNQLIFNVSDIGSGKTTTLTLTNKLGKRSPYTLYYEAEGMFLNLYLFFNQSALRLLYLDNRMK